MSMKSLLVAVASIVVCGAVLAYAAGRVREGQWETTVNMMGRTITSSACMSGLDAAAMNGDIASIRTFAEKKNATTGCKVTNVAINGNQVAITSVCAGQESVGTTTYHGGDAFETVNTNGVKAQAKRVGDCK